MLSTSSLKSVFSLLVLSCCLPFAACKKNKQDNTPVKSTTYTFSYSGKTFVADTVYFTSDAPSSAKFLWDLGDSSTASVAAPNHVYTAAGTYNVALVIDGDTAHTIRQSLTITVDSTYDFSFSGATSPGGIVYFSSKAKSDSKFLWSFGDGSTSTDAAPQHIYSVMGAYTVSLVIDCKTAHTAKKVAKIGVDPAIMAALAGTRIYHLVRHIYHDTEKIDTMPDETHTIASSIFFP
ncbi:MAG: hypothetical protein JWQ38_232 [Flavipsychrobacter sp.]|nr:hypothetical protein [Flavipsychrobacter sp.]